MEYKYNYDAARRYCKELDMKFMEDWVPGIDAAFSELELTQGQVDALMWEYAYRVKHLFTPKNYKFWDRVKFALYFIKG